MVALSVELIPDVESLPLGVLARDVIDRSLGREDDIESGTWKMNVNIACARVSLDVR